MAFHSIFGLGNPGSEYKETRHNVGFMVLENLAARQGVSFAKERKFAAQLAKVGGLHLIMPLTYMNLSGQTVGKVRRFYQITEREILVIYDDLDLPLGKLRFRAKGSAGGHNGIKSIIQHLGTDEFPRLKLGIGRGVESRGTGEVVDHVLGRFGPEEQDSARDMINRAAEAVLLAHEQGIEAAMLKFNS